MKKFLKDNRGLTMLEIVVVLGMMVVVMGVAGLSLAIIPSSEAKKCVTSVDAMFTRTRTGTLTRAGDVVMAVTVDSDGSVWVRYYEEDDYGNLYEKEWEKLSSKGNVSVSYLLKSSTAPIGLGTDESLVFSFSRNTMGFETLSVAEGKASSEADLGSIVDDDDFCITIWFEGGGTSYHIELSPLTGSHYSSLY